MQSQRLRQQPVASVGLSSVVKFELYYGAYTFDPPDRQLELIADLQLPVVEFNDDDGRSAGRVRARLKKLGTPIGPYDTQIAGQALVRGLTLVTHNTREFSRVEGLQIEDWLADQSPP